MDIKEGGPKEKGNRKLKKNPKRKSKQMYQWR